MSDKKVWKVSPSRMAEQTFNPIRDIVDTMKLEPNPNKPMIPLSIGDPTVFGNLPPPAEAIEAVSEAVNSGLRNGYAPSSGYSDAREAVAKYLTNEGVETTAENVFLSSGCSNALEIAISALVNPGENVLIPRPGFSLYKTLCLSQGIRVKSYNCLPEKLWNIDLENLESMCDDMTRAIVIVNPSNPCGSNFNEQHIEDIMAVADRCKVPIIADEIYAGLVFKPHSFTSSSSVSDTVPVLTCGGISKKFVVPGWRLGWVVMHDKNDLFGKQMRDSLQRLTQRILGPCTLVQAILPKILGDLNSSFVENIIGVLQSSAEYAFNRLSNVEGLLPVRPQAAMYMMVGIKMDHFPNFKDDLDFTEKLVSEQSVFCLPAKCFDYPNYFRIVITVPKDKMEEACNRIQEFCSKYYKP